DDFVLAGQLLYENSCASCHGTPGQADFTRMSPTPGDVASERFQIQEDGELFFKIRTGRESMPSFAEAFGEDEIWQLVAYIRSFNQQYEQPVPNLGGIEIPKLSLKLDFDDNVDKLVVRVFKDDSIQMADANVSAYIKSMFGKFSLGSSKTNELGLAYFDVDTKLPGDEEGQLEIIAKASKNYGTAKVQQKIKMVEPTPKESAIEGRHLWSKRFDAPFWLQVIFHGSVFGVWAALLYVVFGLRRIKKLS
ncbi:MAG: cytochrome c, partial [Bacteroidetes bacterium]|nr:cytochrome c [Bacteroidota bacterium]